MKYDRDRLLGGDPSYAPGMIRAKDLFYWRPPSRFTTAGYRKDLHPLAGRAGDGQDAQRVARVHDLCREAERWLDGLDKPRIEPGTWGWLIGRYYSDDISPFQDLKANTKKDYRVHINAWLEAIGKSKVSDADYVALKRWQKAMADKGYSRHKIKARFTKLRIVVGYGVNLSVPGAINLKAILSEMRFSAPSTKTTFATEEQVMAIVRQADLSGQHGVALGLLMQWWFAFRAVDVRGQWLDGRWADGTTWDMFDKELTTFSKVISKTAGSTQEPVTFDLTLVPDIRARLMAIPADQRVGPVIRMRNGQPFKERNWTAVFAKLRKKAGVPDEVKDMDIRAGAINHAKDAGASQEERQRQANHASPSMTERYTRGNDVARNRVIQLRVGTNRQP